MANAWNGSLWTLFSIPLLPICLGPGNRWLASQSNLGNGNNCVPFGSPALYSQYFPLTSKANLTANTTQMNLLKL